MYIHISKTHRHTDTQAGMPASWETIKAVWILVP